MYDGSLQDPDAFTEGHNRGGVPQDGLGERICPLNLDREQRLSLPSLSSSDISELA